MAEMYGKSPVQLRLYLPYCFPSVASRTIFRLALCALNCFWMDAAALAN